MPTIRNVLKEEYEIHREVFLNENNRLITHIEDCANTSEDYIKTSIRQLKSIFNRRAKRTNIGRSTFQMPRFRGL